MKQPADLIIKSKNIFDSVQDEPFAGFIAIRGNRIAAVGKASANTLDKTGIPECAETLGVDDWIGEGTKVFDAGDRLVMAGFHDSHTHLILAGMYQNYVNLGAARHEEEAAEMLQAYEAAHPTTGWVYGFNWYHVFWEKKELPKKETLDRYFPDRPVFLLNAEAHGAWVNTKALELAGITKDTQDPFGGQISRTETGEPAGFLYESAIGLVAGEALRFSEEQERTFLRKYMESAAKLGITSVVDVQPYFGQELGSPALYAAMEQEGKLQLRISVAGDLLGDLRNAVKNKEIYHTEKVRAHLLKQFVDGVITTHTALLLEDYTDAPGNRGTELYHLEEIDAAIQKAHKLGLWIKIHAIGDRAIRLTIDSYQHAIETYGAKGCRHAIEHAEMTTEEDQKRFGKLGLIPSVQPEHIGLMPTWEGEEYRHTLGDIRAGKTWPLKSLLQQAGVIAIGSDCPVVANNPFFAIHRGITRLHDDGLPTGGWNPTEKLTLSEVLKGYTYGSAYGVGREEELGTLEAGKLADIVMIDRNLFEIEPHEIRQAQVDLTVMDGAVIYRRNNGELLEDLSGQQTLADIKVKYD